MTFTQISLLTTGQNLVQPLTHGWPSPDADGPVRSPAKCFYEVAGAGVEHRNPHMGVLPPDHLVCASGIGITKNIFIRCLEIKLFKGQFKLSLSMSYQIIFN